MKKTFACAVRPNKAPSMRRGLSIISLEHSYGLNGSRIFDPTQMAPKCNICMERLLRIYFQEGLFDTLLDPTNPDPHLSLAGVIPRLDTSLKLRGVPPPRHVATP